MPKYLFIDGAFFESVFSPMIKHMFPNEDLFTAVDLEQLTKPYDRVFYYDALPAKKTSESDSDWQSRRDQKEALFNKLSLSRNLHVRSGVSRYRRGRGTEQKGVDILLAIEALQHATSGNIDVACFLLSDLDFFPLFDALIQTRVKSILYYDPHKTSKDLIYAADVAEALNAATLNPWLRNDLRTRTKFFLIRRGRVSVPLTFDQNLIDNLVDTQTGQCGSRTIILGKLPTSDEYIACYEGDDQGFSGRVPYMLLSAFENVRGLKVTGFGRFGFP